MTTGTPPRAAIKFANEDQTAVDMLLLPYGGPLNGRDTAGEFFSAKTNFCLEWYPDRRPLLYHHGLDPDTGVKTVGYIESITMKADGGWARAQLDRHNEYYSDIKDLIERQALGASSGAMSHLVKVSKSGHIDQWPVVEGSLTPTPCNILAQVDYATAKAHYKAAGLPTERLVPPVPTALPAEYYLYSDGAKSVGRYRDDTGTVAGDLLDVAIQEVDQSDLPDAIKVALLSQARQIAAAHGMRTAIQITAGSATKATWTTALVNGLPDSAFLYIEPDGKRDGDGKTTPRSLRHFPYKNTDGTVDLPHLRNALARIPQSGLPDDIKQRVASKARKIAKDQGIEAEAAKAMVTVLDTPTDADADNGYEGSYEDLIDDLRDLLNPSSPWSAGGYSCILRTYPTYVIVSRYDEGEQTYWRVTYSLNDVGEPVLGDAIQVEQTYVPVKAFLATGPLALDAHAVAASAAALATRTQGVCERRTKDGRTFSTANTKELRAAADQSIAAGQKIHDLIASAAKRSEDAAKAAAFDTPEARARRLHLLALAAV